MLLTLLYSGNTLSDCTNNINNMSDVASLKDTMKCLQLEIDKLNSLHTQLKKKNSELEKQLNEPSKWPHAINCGTPWDALFILHANPLDNAGPAWYVQVYNSSYRHVKFNSDLSYNDWGGDNKDSLIGCINKSITQLRAAGRTYEFIKK